MRKYSTFLILFLFVIACNVDKSRKVDSDKLKYGTTDASLLFFKNVRQFYYDKVDNEAAKLWVNRLSKRITESETPLINLAIVINWRYEEAYLLLEPSGIPDEQDEIIVAWKNSKTGESGSYYFEFGNKDSHLKFAMDVYNGILEEQEFIITAGKNEFPFLYESKEREAFRITMFDYMKLVNLI
jgi:hypothetical protein